MLQQVGESFLKIGVQYSLPMLQDVRQRFPELVANLVCLGLPVGVLLGLRGARQNETARPPFRWGRAIVAGGFAGVASGLIFGYWMLAGDFFPLLAGLGEFRSQTMAVAAQFGVALAIGATFGLLFQRDVHGYGSCMGWGVGYTMLWWFAGPLFLFPLLTHVPLNWSAEHASDLFGALVGHILYGLILGISYATFDRIWVRLFIQSDPLNRKPEGPGLRILRSLQWGLAAGFAGGVVSSPVMIATGMLPRAHHALVEGLLLHLLVSALIGMNFGLLFRDEASNIGVGIGWGWLFGLMWWYAGPMTLLPLLSTGEIDWRPSAAATPPALCSRTLDLWCSNCIRFSCYGTSIQPAKQRRSKNMEAADRRLSPLFSCSRTLDVRAWPRHPSPGITELTASTTIRCAVGRRLRLSALRRTRLSL